MYTRCPECNQAHPLTVDELRTSHGMMNCDSCNAMYDALDLLSEGQLNSQEIDNSANIEPIDILTRQPHSLYWSIACLFLLGLLIFQLYYFEAYKLSQNPRLRPWLEKICQKIPDCQLPDYQNPNELAILNGSFQPSNEHYVFKTTFINQSQFPQKLPAIKLSLLDFNSKVFINRVFHPNDYSKQPKKLISPNSVTEITIKLASPDGKVAGYQFELI